MGELLGEGGAFCGWGRVSRASVQEWVNALDMAGLAVLLALWW